MEFIPNDEIEKQVIFYKKKIKLMGRLACTCFICAGLSLFILSWVFLLLKITDMFTPVIISVGLAIMGFTLLIPRKNYSNQLKDYLSSILIPSALKSAFGTSVTYNPDRHISNSYIYESRENFFILTTLKAATL